MSIAEKKHRAMGLICLWGFYFVVMGSSFVFAGEEYEMFTELLGKYVADGQVDYKGMAGSKTLDSAIEQFAGMDPQKLSSREEKLAFWINVYNAYTLKVICDNYPLKSISELHRGGLVWGSLFKTTVWHKKFVKINNETTSLDFIEHKILRAGFNEPRIHFALVCAAKSCPPLRSEAYRAETINEQLNDQARKFLSQPDKNRFDLQKQTATISSIFSWFKKDFGSNSREVLIYLAQYLSQELKEDISANAQLWKIKYTPYDWNLNEQ